MAFSGNNNDVQIVVSVDATGAVKILDQLGETVGKVDKAVKSGESKWTTYNQALEGVKKTFEYARDAGELFFNTIERGSEVDDVASAYAKLAQSLGANADLMMNEMRKASAGTIADLALQKKAIESFRAGIKPDEFLTIIKASRALGEEGSSLAVELDTLSRAFETGQTRMLKNRLGLIDTAKAQEDLKAAMGGASVELTAQGELFANRTALMDAANKKVQETGEISLDAGDKVGQFKAQWTNLTDAFAKDITSIADIDEVMKALSSTINGISYVLTESAKGWAMFISTASNMGQAFVGAKNLDEAYKSILETQVKIFELKPTATKENEAANAKTYADAVSWLGKEFDKLLGITKPLTKEKEKLNKATLGLVKPSKDALDASKKLREELKKLTTEPKKAADEFLRLNQLTRDTARYFTDSQDDIYRFGEAMVLAAGDALKLEQQLVKLGDTAQAAGQKTAKGIEAGIEGALPDAKKGQQSEGPIADWIATQLDVTNEDGAAIVSTVSDALSTAINMATQKGLTGVDYGSMAGSAIGAAIGAKFGLSQLGAQIGAIVGTGIANASKDAASTKERKQIDKYFAELFDAKRLSIIVGDEIKKLNDLVFSGKTLFGGDIDYDTIGNQLASMTAGAQAGFEGVGTAIAQLNGFTDQWMTMFSSVLANNLGDLNNLQIMLETMGVTTQELSEALLVAFEESKISAMEFGQQLMAIEEIGKKGIPDAFGDVAQAWENIAAAGWSGGRALLNALGDVGAEAQELGMSTLPQMADYLTNVLHYDAAQIAQFMEAMKQSGINSIADLVNAGNQQLGILAANMQAASEGKPMSFTYTPPPSSISSGGSRGGSSSKSSAAAEKARAKAAFNKQVQDAVTGSSLYSAWQQGTGSQAELTAIYSEFKGAMKDVDTLTAKAAEDMKKYGYVTTETAKALDKANDKLDKLKEKSKETTVTMNQGLYDFAKLWAGNLDMIGLAADALGVSLKSLQKSTLEAYMAGKMTAVDAQAALGNLGPGIAGQHGAVGQALGNLKTHGTKGGRFTINDLKDIGAEAQDLNGKTVDDLMQIMTQQGIDPTQAMAFYTTLRNSGITTMDQLVNLSDETGIKIAAGLSQAGFAFDETQQGITDILSQVNEMVANPKELVINVTANMDEATRNLLESLGVNIPSSYGTGSPGLSQSGAGGGLSADQVARRRRRREQIEAGKVKPKKGTYGYNNQW